MSCTAGREIELGIWGNGAHQSENTTKCSLRGMTATGATRAMGTQGPPPPRSRLALFSFRSRKRKEEVIRGRLRMKSSPGAFLVLGVVVVIVGVAVAAVGYWPYRAVLLGQVGVEAELGRSQVAEWGLEERGGPLSSERMKLLGPVLMGVGLFILICANSVLYENRDHETQRLLAQARAAIGTVSASVAQEATPYGRALSKHYQWVAPFPTTNLGLHHLGALVGSEPALLRLQAEEGKPANVRRPLVAPWPNAEPSSKVPSAPVSLHSLRSDSSNSSKLNLTVLTTASLTGPGAAPPGRDGCVVTAPPRRCYSLSSRAGPHQESGGTLRKMSSPHVCLNMADPRDRSPDAGTARRHCSWPRLDLSGARRYLKLENKEASVDRLLDRLELQYSQREKSYGSGPFQ